MNWDVVEGNSDQIVVSGLGQRFSECLICLFVGLLKCFVASCLCSLNLVSQTRVSTTAQPLGNSLMPP